MSSSFGSAGDYHTADQPDGHGGWHCDLQRYGHGTSPLSYQWSFNRTNILGATNATLTLTNVQMSQAGNYTVLVTNAYGSVLSSNAVLTVFVPGVPPTILSQTPNQIVLLGNTATFSVTAGGSVPLSYFWQRNGALIPGATNSSYALHNAQLSDSGSKFHCLVTNAFGSAASTNVSLKVIDTIANDLCSGAILITNASYSNVQSTDQCQFLWRSRAGLRGWLWQRRLVSIHRAGQRLAHRGYFWQRL